MPSYFSRLDTHAYDVERDQAGDDNQFDPARNRDPDRKSQKQDADEGVTQKIAPVGQIAFEAAPSPSECAARSRFCVDAAQSSSQ